MHDVFDIVYIVHTWTTYHLHFADIVSNLYRGKQLIFFTSVTIFKRRHEGFAHQLCCMFHTIGVGG